MKKLLIPVLACAALAGCVSTKDLAKTLRYADQRAISVGEFQFAELGALHKGSACTVNFLNWFPLFGDGSLITAVERGKINRIRYIGETGYWYFPFSTNCTVVFGDDIKSYSPDSAAAVTPQATGPAEVPADELSAAAQHSAHRGNESAGIPQPAPSLRAPRRGFWE